MIRMLLGLFILSLIIARPALAMDVESFKAQQRAWEDQSHITRGDLAFFFDRISFTDHGWEFKLSPNVPGMLWRIRKEKTDITGACDSGQVLNLPAGASLEVKQKGLVLFFEPRGVAGFQVRLSIETKIGDSMDHEAREALLAADGAGFGLMYAED